MMHFVEILYNNNTSFFEFLKKLYPEFSILYYYWEYKYFLNITGGTIQLDSTVLYIEPTLEKNANITIVMPLDNTWTIMSLDNLFFYFLLGTLMLPLIYCFLTMGFFFKNQVRRNFFGQINLLENKNINFTIFTKNQWRTLWNYTFDLVPRYSEIIEFLARIRTPNTEFWNKMNYPNPRVALAYARFVFFWRHKPRYLWYLFNIFFLFILLYYRDFTGLSLFLFFYLVAAYTDWKDFGKRSSFGLLWSRRIAYKFKKRSNTRIDLIQILFLRLRQSFYPLFFSFFMFCFTTTTLIYLYLDFYFNPLMTWNGYFSKTIISFFLNHSNSSNSPITIDYFIALDGLNIWLIWLTSLLVLLCSLYLLDTIKLQGFVAQLGWIYLLAFASFQFFCVPNYLWMYIYFELSLLPIFILIVFWGSNWRKIHAAYQMVLFTFIGSLFLLAGIFLLYNKIGSFNTFDIFNITQADQYSKIFSNFEKKLIWLLLFIGFAVKTPLYPFHIWLPEAHSEAPTTGSVMLAGVLLKMGTYGFLRFVIPVFPSVLETFKTLVFSMCLCGILLSSLAALAQIDIKKIIAYSSIGHMGIVIIGIYTLNLNGLLGASYMMLSHGLISSALFFSIGLLYKIYGTRSIIYYTSIAHFMPRFSMCFFVFNLANMSFPGTAGFPGELLIFSSMMEDNFFLSLFVGLGSIFGGVYSIWLITWVLYGQISPKISTYRDLLSSEWKILNFLLILIIVFGIFPFFLLDFFKPMCVFLIQLKNF